MPWRAETLKSDTGAVRAILRAAKTDSPRKFAARFGKVAAQFRRRYKQGALPRKIVRALEAIPGWAWTSAEWHYATILAAVEEYARLHGLQGITGTTHHRGLPIGDWLLQQRKRYRRGTTSRSLALRLEALAGWTSEYVPTTRRHATRTQRIASRHLEVLTELLTHPEVAPRGRSTSPVSKRLFYLRRYFRRLRAAGQLPDGMARQLESLPGWSWADESPEERDRKRLRIVTRLAKQGQLHELVPGRRVDGVPVASWLAGCRVRILAGTCPAWLRQKLEGLPGWNVPIRKVDAERRNLALLRRFVRRHPLHHLRRRRIQVGVDLYHWVQHHRAKYRAGDRESIHRELEKLPGWEWNPRAARRDRLIHTAQQADGSKKPVVNRTTLDSGPSIDMVYVRLIQAYLKQPREGWGCMERRAEINGVSLAWMTTKFRNLHARGKLAPEIETALSQTPGWSWTPVEDRFQRHFELVRRFVARHGIAALTDSVVFEGVAIGTWMNIQRGQCRRGVIRPAFRQKLESLPGFRPTKDLKALNELIKARRLQSHLAAVRAHFAGQARLEVRAGRGRRSQPTLGRLRTYFSKLRAKGRLSKTVEAELARHPGFLTAPRDEVARHRVALLRKLAGRTGLPEITPSTHVDGERVGRWVDHCCKRHREGRLDPWLERELTSISGWMWKRSRDEQKERKQELLLQYLEDRGFEDLVHHPMRNGVNLRGFVISARRRYRAEKLPDDQIRFFESLPGWSWNPRSDDARRRWKRPGRRSTAEEERAAPAPGKPGIPEKGTA